MNDYNNMQYEPFRYPPDYALARIHKQASMPGKKQSLNQYCPCCNEPLKKPFESWWNRSIEKDFKSFGGAVVSYFWLLKLYAITIGLIIVIYSSYLAYVTESYCPDLLQEKCTSLLGLWVVTNEDLYDLIKARDDDEVIVRLSTLRAVVFLILLVTNFLSMYVVRQVKVRYPSKESVAEYTLIFKNVTSESAELFSEGLKKEFGQNEIRQVFLVHRLEPYYSLYQQKMKTYYQSLNEQNTRKLKKQLVKLQKLDALTEKYEEEFLVHGNRMIVTFTSQESRRQAMDRYMVSHFARIGILFSSTFQRQLIMYCQECPRPQQILWNNIGKMQQQTLKIKLLSILYFLLLLGGSYLMLFFCMQVVYKQEDISQPWNTILQNFILIFLVAVALTFRQFMNKLSNMRYPNTYTNKTLFIVVTTLLFHFIYYLIIPTMYLRFQEDSRGRILKVISNQTINFVIVHIIIAGFDLMYCCWNRRQQRVEDEERPIGCQKMLHESIEYPRFPMQFKLIILFKIWSFIIFFGFQVPLVLFLIFLILIYLYVKDKHSVYHHYRMEIIHNNVQFNFLRIYSNFFTFYMYIIFIFTQHVDIERYIALAVTICTILFQTYYFRKITVTKATTDTLLPTTIDDLDSIDSYQKRYNAFIQSTRSEQLDRKIKEYLVKNRLASLQTEDDPLGVHKQEEGNVND